jgi:hypothetical protein
MLDTSAIPWIEIKTKDSLAHSISKKILCQDRNSNARTQIMSVKKGVRTEFPEAHICSEESFIFSGKIRHTSWFHPGRNGTEMITGTGFYSYRTPGHLHGPWEALEDTVLLEMHTEPFTVKVNPFIWECNACHDKILWELNNCGNCGEPKSPNQERFKPVPTAETFEYST